MTQRHQHIRKYVNADRHQPLLMPPDLRDWVHEGHEARFFVAIVGKLDLTKFYEVYEKDVKDWRGRPPLDPALMIALIFYCISQRQYSVRGMERMTYNDIGARYVAGNHHPDHSTIAKFQIRHAKELTEVFTQVVLLCHQAGLIDLLHVAIDSTVILADASRTKSVEVEKIEELLKQCKERAEALLNRLKEANEEEEKALKSGLRRQELHNQRLQSAFDFIQEREKQNRALEEEAKAKQQEALKKAQEDLEESRAIIGAIVSRHRKESGWSLRQLSAKSGINYKRLSELEHGDRPLSSDERSQLVKALGIEEAALPLPSEKCPLESLKRLANPNRINLIDRDSYLIHRKNHGYRQGFLAQAITDSKCQIILGGEISPGNDDHPALHSLLSKVHEIFHQLPKRASADTGYASEANFTDPRFVEVDLYVKTVKTSKPAKNPLPATDAMRTKLETEEGKEIYKCRAKTVEPPFGQIKHDRGFTRFLRVGVT